MLLICLSFSKLARVQIAEALALSLHLVLFDILVHLLQVVIQLLGMRADLLQVYSSFLLVGRVWRFLD